MQQPSPEPREASGPGSPWCPRRPRQPPLPPGWAPLPAHKSAGGRCTAHPRARRDPAASRAAAVRTAACAGGAPERRGAAATDSPGPAAPPAPAADKPRRQRRPPRRTAHRPLADSPVRRRGDSLSRAGHRRRTSHVTREVAPTAEFRQLPLPARGAAPPEHRESRGRSGDGPGPAAAPKEPGGGAGARGRGLAHAPRSRRTPPCRLCACAAMRAEGGRAAASACCEGGSPRNQGNIVVFYSS